MATKVSAPPNQWALLLHIHKTYTLIRAVLADARVHWLSKAVFLSCIGAMLLVLLGGDLMAGVAESVVPLIGPAVGLPVDASLDWVAFAVVAFNLLKLFPTEIVGEHYDRLFRSKRRRFA
jgi:hypothetical protein